LLSIILFGAPVTSSLISNNAASTLASSITDADTNLVLATGDGALFPSPTGIEWFPLTLQSSAAIEILKATARSGDSITVERAQEGTTAMAFSAGDGTDFKVTFDASGIATFNAPA
jgi:hypothetical protein